MYCVKYGRAPRCNKRLPVALVMLEKQAKDISSARHKLPSTPSSGCDQLSMAMQSKLQKHGRSRISNAVRSCACTLPTSFETSQRVVGEYNRDAPPCRLLLRARRCDAVKLNALVLSGKARPTLVPLLYFCSDLTSAHAPCFQGYLQPLGGGGHLLSIL